MDTEFWDTSCHLHDRISPSAVSISTQWTLSFGTPSRHLHDRISPSAVVSLYREHWVLGHRHVTYCYMITAPGNKNTYSRWTLCFGTPSRHLLYYSSPSAETLIHCGHCVLGHRHVTYFIIAPRLQKHIFTVDTVFWDTVTSPTLLQLPVCGNIFNPFTAPACKTSGLKGAHIPACKQYFGWSYTNLLSILGSLVEILSRANAKGERASLISNLALLSVVFRVTARRAWQ